MCSQDRQSIEPTTSLVQSLCNEITREAILELLLVLKRIVLGCIRHASRFEPAIKHLAYTAKLTLPLLTRDGNIVHLVAVEVRQVSFVSTELLELLSTTDNNNFLVVLADPQGHRCTPESVSRNVPVSGILDPARESTILDKRRYPVGFFNALQHVRDDVGDLDEPSGHGSIDQRSVGTPAEGITVSNLAVNNQAAGCLQMFNDILVSGLDILTHKVSDLGGITTLRIDRVGRCAALINDA